MPTSGGPGQQAIPKAIRAMPATRANGWGEAGKFLTQQQPPDERGNNQQRQSGSGFGDSSENQHVFHCLDFARSFLLAMPEAASATNLTVGTGPAITEIASLRSQ